MKIIYTIKTVLLVVLFLIITTPIKIVIAIISRNKEDIEELYPKNLLKLSIEIYKDIFTELKLNRNKQ